MAEKDKCSNPAPTIPNSSNLLSRSWAQVTSPLWKVQPSFPRTQCPHHRCPCQRPQPCRLPQLSLSRFSWPIWKSSEMRRHRDNTSGTWSSPTPTWSTPLRLPKWSAWSYSTCLLLTSSTSWTTPLPDWLPLTRRSSSCRPPRLSLKQQSERKRSIEVRRSLTRGPLNWGLCDKDKRYNCNRVLSTTWDSKTETPWLVTTFHRPHTPTAERERPVKRE